VLRSGTGSGIFGLPGYRYGPGTGYDLFDIITAGTGTVYAILSFKEIKFRGCTSFKML
jgi:hypothetical protein